jgi:two-component system, NarL family, nitrate/nitrite response regulator NarL
VAAVGDPGTTIRVFVIGDVRFYREGLAELLVATGRIAVVGTAAATDEALRRASAADPDVVLLDTAMVDGVATAKRLAELMPRSKIVALAVPESEEELILLVEAGVLGYVTREESLDEVVAAITSVVLDQTVGSPKLRTLLIKRVRALAAEYRPRAGETLTERERQVLDLVAQGLTNKRIAAELQIEPSTVKNHVHNILHKLGVASRAGAVAEARRSLHRLPTAAVAGAEFGRLKS